MSIDWSKVRTAEDKAAAARDQALDRQLTRLRGIVADRLAHGVEHAGRRWRCELADQLHAAGMAASIASGRGLPHGRQTIGARSADRSRHELTAQQYLDLAEARRDYVVAVQERAEDLTDQLLAAADPDAVDPTRGWPD